MNKKNFFHILKKRKPLIEILSAFFIFILFWQISSFFFDPWILPSPLQTFQETKNILNQEYFPHIYATFYRILIGFSLSFFLGNFLGLLSFLLKVREWMNMILILFQVIPGVILGIIFLMLFGIGHEVPIFLIMALTIPIICIQTSYALYHIDHHLEAIVRLMGGNFLRIFWDIWFPALIPTMRSNLTVGFGIALKIVVLGEFIGCQNGIGYLLQNAKVYFKMSDVFFHLFTLLLIMVLFQILIELIFITFFKKYLFQNQGSK